MEQTPIAAGPLEASVGQRRPEGNMETKKRKWGPEPHNFGKPMGYAVVAPSGMLDGGAHTFRGDAQKVIDWTDTTGAPYANHRIVELWPIPEGWQLVPKEPTGDMLNAAWNAAQVGRSPQEDRAVWTAMLEAAPKTPNG